MTKPKPRKIELVSQDYQPSKSEVEEPVALTDEDGNEPTPEELMRAVVQPVDITFVPKPRKK